MSILDLRVEPRGARAHLAGLGVGLHVLVALDALRPPVRSHVPLRIVVHQSARHDLDEGRVEAVGIEPDVARAKVRHLGGIALLAVAGHALRVQDALHKTRIVERLRAFRLRRQLRRRTPESLRRGGGRGGGAAMPRLVAAVARKTLARLRIGDGPHGLHRAAVFVERLEIDGRLDRHAEVRAAVRLHRHGAQALPAAHLVDYPQARMAVHRFRLGEHLPHAQRRDLHALRERIARVIDVDQPVGRSLRQLGFGNRLRTIAIRVRRTPKERAVRNHGRHLARPQRNRFGAGDRRMLEDANLVAKGVQERQAILAALIVQQAGILSVAVAVVGAEVILLGERPGRAIAARRTDRPGDHLFGLGQQHLWRQALDLSHLTVIGHGRIEQHERPAIGRMVTARHGHVATRTRNGADGLHHVRRAALVEARVAVQFARVASVGIRDPGVVGLVEATVRIVPARIDHHAVVIDGRLPLVRFVRREADDVRAVREHGVEREVGHLAHVAASEAAAPFGDEQDASVRQPAREKVVDAAPGEHREVGAVGLHLHDVEGRLLVPFARAIVPGRPTEEDFLSVPAEVGREESALARDDTAVPVGIGRMDLRAGGCQFLQARFLAEGILQRPDAVAEGGGLERGVETEVLVAHVRAPGELVGGGRLARDEEELVDVLQERIGEGDLAAKAHGALKERVTRIVVRDGRGGGFVFQLLQGIAQRAKRGGLVVAFLGHVALEIVGQRARAPQQYVERIAILWPDEGLGIDGLFRRRLEEWHVRIAVDVALLARHGVEANVALQQAKRLQSLLPLANRRGRLFREHRFDGGGRKRRENGGYRNRRPWTMFHRTFPFSAHRVCVDKKKGVLEFIFYPSP